MINLKGKGNLKHSKKEMGVKITLYQRPKAIFCIRACQLNK